MLRKCVGCGELKDTENLIKITKEHQSGELFLNPNSKIFGRSAYLCYNNSCIESAFKKNKLAKVLKCPVPSDLKGQVLNELRDKENK